MKKYDFDNILKLYATIFPFLIFLFLCLNFTCGTIYGDISHSPYGDVSNIINFLILLCYIIAIVINITLFCLAKHKKYFYFNLNMNIIACLIFACLPYSLLIIAFGFMIAGPLLLLFVSLWSSSWAKVCKYNSKNSYNYACFNAFKYIFPILLLISMLIMTLSFFFEFGVDKIIGKDINNKLFELSLKTDTYRYSSRFKRLEQERIDIAKRFHYYISKIKINPKVMTYNQIFDVYENYFKKKENINAIFGEDVKVEMKRYDVKGRRNGTDYNTGMHGFSIYVYMSDNRKYSIFLTQEKDNNYYWNIYYPSHHPKCFKHDGINLVMNINSDGEITKYEITPPTICYLKNGVIHRIGI